MHGDRKLGFEVMPSNVEATVDGLRLSYEMWDYTQPKPQAAAFKKWLKSQLVRGHPVVWFPMCKGDLLSPFSAHHSTLLCPPSSFLAYGSLFRPRVP